MKTTNKSDRITVRLTPHQNFMLDEIAKKVKVSKSALTRYIIEEFIAKYDETK